MASGLVALLDDVASIAKVAAASVDDVAESIGGGGFVAWLVGAFGSGIFGLILGAVIVGALSLIPRRGH
jgi:predicted DNA repair protein MutK